MGYVNERYYLNTHGGRSIEGLAELIERASILIDGLTHNRIIASGLENLTAFQRKAVKRSCCLIVDYMAADGPDGTIESFALNDLRVKIGRRKRKPWEDAGCGMWAWLTLLQTGLMRGSFR